MWATVACGYECVLLLFSARDLRFYGQRELHFNAYLHVSLYIKYCKMFLNIPKR